MWDAVSGDVCINFLALWAPRGVEEEEGVTRSVGEGIVGVVGVNASCCLLFVGWLGWAWLFRGRFLLGGGIVCCFRSRGAVQHVDDCNDDDNKGDEYGNECTFFHESSIPLFDAGYCSIRGMKRFLDILLHKWLGIPYALHVTTFRNPKKARATIVLLHGIGTSTRMWDDLIPHLPKDIRVIGIDLLGFGKSPRPPWSRYDADAQARAVSMTLFKEGLSRQVVLAGHSLGALVSVAIARRYPLMVRQLVLCSPPFYGPDTGKRTLSRESILKDMYKIAHKNPERLVNLSPILVKLGLTSKVLDINEENVGAYMAALSSSIINQKSLEEARRLRTPTRILYGAFDPVVIGGHITDLEKVNSKITAKMMPVGHEVMGVYVKVLSGELSDAIEVFNKT